MTQLISAKSFFDKYNIEEETFNKTTLKWNELQAIYDDYYSEIPTLESSATYIFQ